MLVNAASLLSLLRKAPLVEVETRQHTSQTATVAQRRAAARVGGDPNAASQSVPVPSCEVSADASRSHWSLSLACRRRKGGGDMFKVATVARKPREAHASTWLKKSCCQESVKRCRGRLQDRKEEEEMEPPASVSEKARRWTSTWPSRWRMTGTCVCRTKTQVVADEDVW